MEALIELITDPDIMFPIMAATAVFATVLTVAMPLLSRDRLNDRMKVVASERERIRQRERARLNEEKTNIRQEPKVYMKNVVEKLNLRRALLDEKTTDQLTMAGYRGQGPLVAFLFARFVVPLIILAVALIYLFFIGNYAQPASVKLLIALGVAYLGFYMPNIFVRNAIGKRQQSIRRAWPDALDLLLICVESGMSIEAAFKKVSIEIGSQSIPLAEELSLTTAELSYLQDRRLAYENLGKRTGLEGVKAVVTSLIQAERYGTPIGTALRTLSDESRKMRMLEAEKKAAALPPKLTVPMIVFFLPVLVAVIVTPAAIQIMDPSVKEAATPSARR